MTKISPKEPSKGRWPRWARRAIMENVAIALILFGVFMLVQPFSITLYGWSFLTVLAGVVMFTVVSKFPE
jgi:VIT1/CCC1 family predicted Fe2+/Mn2+ transporter